MKESERVPPPSESPPAAGVSVRKKLLFGLVLYAGLVLLFEVGARAVFFAKEGFNPFYLTFGLVANTERPSDEAAGYVRFEPNTVKHQTTARGTLTMQINDDGFRGLYDFRRPKPEGVFRVAALGASSTFGLLNPDDETYPYLLEQMLREQYPGLEVEVLNLGIPEAKTAEILALARHQLPELDPDVVTLYSGANNSIRNEERSEGGRLYRLKDWLTFHSVAYRAIHPLVREVYYSIARRSGTDVVGVPNLMLPVSMTPPEVDDVRSAVRADYAADVESLAELVEGLGAQFILVTQSYTLHNLRNTALDDKWRSYDEEVAYVEQQLSDSGVIPAPHSTLLVHRDLMNELRALASRRNLTLIEGIDLLDPDREHMMASWVHLTRDANERIAASLRDTLMVKALIRREATGRPGLR